MRLALVAAAAVVLSVSLAHADTFTFSLATNGQTGSGTLSGVPDPFQSGAFDMTSGTGTLGTSDLTLVTPSGNSQTVEYTGGTTPFSYDNVFYTTGNAVDGVGMLFSVDGTDEFLNIFWNASVVAAEGPSSTFNPQMPVTFVVTDSTSAVTPEPSSVALLGTGLLGLAGVLKQRFVAHRSFIAASKLSTSTHPEA